MSCLPCSRPPGATAGVAAPIIPLHPQGRRGWFPFRCCAAIPSVVASRLRGLLASLFARARRALLRKPFPKPRPSGKGLSRPAASDGFGPAAAWSLLSWTEIGRNCPAGALSGAAGTEIGKKMSRYPPAPQGRRGGFPFRCCTAIPFVVASRLRTWPIRA